MRSGAVLVAALATLAGCSTSVATSALRPLAAASSVPANPHGDEGLTILQWAVDSYPDVPLASAIEWIDSTPGEVVVYMADREWSLQACVAVLAYAQVHPIELPDIAVSDPAAAVPGPGRVPLLVASYDGGDCHAVGTAGR